MKKLIYAFLSITALTFVGCTEDLNEGKFNADEESGWVQFAPTEEEIEAGEIASSFKRGGQFLIPVYLQAPVNRDGVEVTYTVEDVEGSSQGTISSSGVVEIPKGTNTGDIVLNFEDVSVSSSTVLKITLTSTNRNNVQVGLEDGSKPVSQLVRICGNAFSTTYEGDSATSDGLPGEIFNVALVPVPGTDNQFTLSTVWGPNFVAALTGNPGDEGQFVYPVTLTVNSDASVTVTTDVPYGEGGTGTYNACSDTFELNVSQSVFTGDGSDFTVDITLTGNGD